MKKPRVRGGPDEPPLPPLPPIVPRFPPCPPGSHRVGGRFRVCVPDCPPNSVLYNGKCLPNLSRCDGDADCERRAREGTLRELPDMGPPPSERDTSRDRPPKRGFVAPPVIPPPITPPTTPPPTPTGPSPADVLPRTYPQQLPIPRGAPVAASVLRSVRNLSIAGVLSFVWALAFGPYLGAQVLARPTGPPRRRGRVRVEQADEFPFGEDPYAPYRPMPRMPGTGLPIPQRRPRVVTVPVDIPTPGRAPMPTRPISVPGTRTPVRTLPPPAPAQRPVRFPEPEAPPGYDPFTYTPPQATPRAPARPIPRARSVPFPFPTGVTFPIGDPVRDPIGILPRTLTPQRPTTRPTTPRPSTPARPRTSPPPRLTPFNPTVPSSQPQPRMKPTEANPCTAQREQRRRRQRDCKRYTTKTIRVCADRS